MATGRSRSTSPRGIDIAARPAPDQFADGIPPDADPGERTPGADRGPAEPPGRTAWTPGRNHRIVRFGKQRKHLPDYVRVAGVRTDEPGLSIARNLSRLFTKMPDSPPVFARHRLNINL